MVERTRLLGLLIILVTSMFLLVPEGFSRQQFSVGLGISHRASGVTAYPNRVNSFEVARIYNTGDEVITVQAVWKPTGTTDIGVDLFPSERTLQPGESYLLTATAATTEHLGTTIGVVEIITLTGVVAPDAFVGGVVVPGAELPFEISVVNPPAEPTQQPLDGRSLGALAGYLIGGVLVLADPEKLVFSI